MDLTPLQFAGLYAAALVVVYGVINLAIWRFNRKGKP